MESVIQPKKGRGPGKKPPLAHVSLRISKEAEAFYSRFRHPTVAMRKVLERFAKDHSQT